MTTSVTKHIPTIVGAGVTMGVADAMLGRRTRRRVIKSPPKPRPKAKGKWGKKR